MKIAVIADDLTGANNSGVRLKKHGFSAATVMHGGATPPRGYDAVCIDVDSRYAPADQARARVAQAAGRMRDQGAELLCKRIDTLLRGNVGAEIDGILSASPAGSIAVVAVTFPESNRVVKGGRLLVEGVPVNENPVAAGDPISPVRHAYVPDIIAEQSAERVATIGLAAMLKGPRALAADLETAANAGIRIVVVDALTTEHVQTLAGAMASIGRSFIPVDPGPLSATYASALFGPRRGGKILVSVGSMSALTREQLEHALQAWQTEATHVRADLLAGEPERRAIEIEKAILETIARVERSDVIVVTTAHATGPINLQLLAHAEGSTPQHLARRIAEGIAEISCEVVRRSKGAIGGCYSSGGDVTAAFYRRAESTGFEIIDEVMPLVAHVRLLGGALDGLLMVTKGGSIGTRSTMTDCLRYLFARLGTQ